METVAANYVAALDELNILMAASWYSAEGDSAARAKQIADDLFSGLINAYALGVRSAASMLETELIVDLDEMEEAIFVLTEGKTFEDRVADHVESNSPGRLAALAESEFHRVYNRAVIDGGETYERRGNPGVTKTWYTKLDSRVRDTHDYLEAMTVPLDQDFYTFDGDHAAYPGGFERVENNANCRCIVRLNRPNISQGPSPAGYRR